MTRAASIPRGWALGLKFARENGKTDGYNGRPVFTWPLTPGAMVVAPDWRPNATCGGGLHFWPDGVGDVAACDYHTTAAHGLVVAYPPAEAVAFGGKAKAARAKIIFAGTPREAATWLAARRPGRPVIYATVTAGDYGTATAGYGGTATAGDYGTATAGDYGTATAGNRGSATAGYRGSATAGYGGTASAGNRGTASAGDGGTASAGYGGTASAGDGGTASAGDYGTATAGYGGTATAGDYGTATAGDYGTATAGNRGSATAGYRGSATAGYGGTASAGDGGTASAGDGGTMSILWWDVMCYRRRCVEVDGIAIKANTPYRLNAAGEFVEVVK